MTNYNAPRQLTAAVLLVLLAACVHTKPKPATAPAPAAAPVPATVAAPAPATTPPPMQTEAPVRYTVKKGDTLWGIANMYLKDPTAWPDIWYANGSIKNPHLIFPGDVLVLGNVGGRPALSVERNGQVATEISPPPVASTVSAPAVTTTGTVATTAPTLSTKATPAAATAVTASIAGPALPVTKLEPQVRYLPLSEAVPAVPTTAIRPFLTQTRIVSKNELDNAGYLLSSQNQEPAMASDTEVYARDLNQTLGARYNVYRVGDKYVDPENGSVLGYQATYIGSAEVETWGEPQKVLLTKTVQEALNGDRLLPVTDDTALQAAFMPHRPAKQVNGQVVSVIGAVQEIGQFGVVVINRGSNAGLDPGAILDIQYKGANVPDPYHGGFLSGTTKLPNANSGTLMVFRVFANASYALVMQSSREIHVEDYVVSP